VLQLPTGSHQLLPRVDYLDAYPLPLPRLLSATEVAQTIFRQGPAWVGVLMRLRNAVVRPLGLHTVAGRATAPGSAQLRSGDFVGPFQVFEVQPQEIVLGLDDRHLDFRVSVRVEAEAVASTAWLSTAVQFHNGFGRFYFALIRPFHGLVVRALLRRSWQRLAAGHGC